MVAGLPGGVLPPKTLKEMRQVFGCKTAVVIGNAQRLSFAIGGKGDLDWGRRIAVFDRIREQAAEDQAETVAIGKPAGVGWNIKLELKSLFARFLTQGLSRLPKQFGQGHLLEFFVR